MLATVHFHKMNDMTPSDRVTIEVDDNATDAEIFDAARAHLLKCETMGTNAASAAKYVKTMPTAVLFSKE